MSELPKLSESEIVDLARRYEDRARTNAPTTVKLTYGGVIVGAAAFGPAGGVVGAVVGSGIGYLTDEGYFDSEEEPDVVEADIEGEV